MPTLLHMSFRVKDPVRSAALYAELLDGHIISGGPVLSAIGVQSIAFGHTDRHELADSLEFWPPTKHWTGQMSEVDARHHQPFGHLAVESTKTYAELCAIADRHGVTIHQESRGPLGAIPVIYDYDGNFLEFFPPMPEGARDGV